MFADPARLAVLEMCEDCRAIAATQCQVDPYAGPARPVVKTTEDWLREARRARRASYSGTVSPEPPNSAGKSLSLGSPSFIGSTVSA